MVQDAETCEGYPRVRTGAQMSGSTSVVRSWPCIAAHDTPVSSSTRSWEKASLLQPGTQEARALRGSLISVSVGPLPYAVCQHDAPMSCQLLWCNSSLDRLHSLKGPLVEGPHSPAGAWQTLQRHSRQPRAAGPDLEAHFEEDLGWMTRPALALLALCWSSFVIELLW